MKGEATGLSPIDHIATLLEQQGHALIDMREQLVLRSGAIYGERATLAEARELRRLAKEAEAAALALKRALASLKYNLGD